VNGIEKAKLRLGKFWARIDVDDAVLNTSNRPRGATVVVAGTLIGRVAAGLPVA
jgi:hypothetical protein